MAEVITVRFHGGTKNYYFDPKGLQIQQNQYVVVETAQGIEYVRCVEENHEVSDQSVVQPLRSVVRIATEADHRTAANNRRREKEAFGICEKKIVDHKLDMKLVNVECSFEGNKITFYFTAEGRVDFRELVKDLASVFRARIELRQIGVRDEAKMLGGLGICGRPLCCSQFLDDFIPVSIKMAKTQNLSLNPSKISGSCGRLMCCLKYEQNAYEDAAKRMPRNESFVDTPDGVGNVSSVDLLKEEVQVRLDTAPEFPRRYKNCEIRILRNGKGSREGIEIPSERPARYVPPEAEGSQEGQFAHRVNPRRSSLPVSTTPPSGNVQEERSGRRPKIGKKNSARPVSGKPVREERFPSREKTEELSGKGEKGRSEKSARSYQEADKFSWSEKVEKVSVRSTGSTTAEKKAAADRGDRKQNTEGKGAGKPYRRPRYRPKGKGPGGAE